MVQNLVGGIRESFTLKSPKFWVRDEAMSLALDRVSPTLGTPLGTKPPNWQLATATSSGNKRKLFIFRTKNERITPVFKGE